MACCSVPVCRRRAVPEAGVCAIVLAAGLGSRFRQESDEDKLLAPLDPGCASPAVLQATLTALGSVAERLLVVVRRDNPALLAAVAGWRADAQVLAIDTDGLGTSLAQGVAACPAERGWLVVLGDMPYIRRETHAQLAAALEPGRLLLPTHNGRPGHPRGIGAEFGSQLRALGGDRGAQSLFASAEVRRLAVDDPGILRDIDRPGDRIRRA